MIVELRSFLRFNATYYQKDISVADIEKSKSRAKSSTNGLWTMRTLNGCIPTLQIYCVV